MIQLQTMLKVADNSGAKTVRCIKVLGGFKKKIAKLGEIVVVSVQKLRKKAKHKVKKKEIYKALIVRTKTAYNKTTGLTTNFNENAVVLINKQGNPMGTRIIGPVPKTLQKKTVKKFTNIAAGLV